MQSIVIDKPYVPVPPHRGKIWPTILRAYARHFLDKHYGIVDISVHDYAGQNGNTVELHGYYHAHVMPPAGGPQKLS